MKSTLGIIGFLLVAGTIYGGGNLKHITDWGSGEMIGYNMFSILAIVGGSYLVYRSFKSEKTEK